jgi:phosphoribosyl-dephospho-CoA transferase
MERLTHGRPAPTHDLIRLRTPIALMAEGPMPSWESSRHSSVGRICNPSSCRTDCKSVLQTSPSRPPWVEPALRRAPWVVVRRGRVREGLVPVGVRGPARHERFAAWLVFEEIAERLLPEDLAVIAPPRREEVPALAALARVAVLLERRGQRWGPGGSVGFEIATGLPIATESSDLDLILRQDRRPAAGEAADLHRALVKAAAPARIDVVLETPAGGVALADLAARPERVLVRTPDGPRLCADPWQERTS